MTPPKHRKPAPARATAIPGVAAPADADRLADLKAWWLDGLSARGIPLQKDKSGKPASQTLPVMIAEESEPTEQEK